MNVSTIQFKGPLAAEFSQFVNQLETINGNHTKVLKMIRRLDEFLAQTHPGVLVLTKGTLSDWFNSFA